MRPPLLLALMALSLPAAAGTPLDRYVGVDTLQIPGTVEVPLLAVPGADLRPCVEVRIDDHPYVFALEPGHDLVVFGDNVVSDLELEAKKRNHKFLNLMGEDAAWRVGGELDIVSVDAMRIGDLTIEGVQGLNPTPNTRIDAVASDAALSGSPGIDGVIGLGALEGLAWAILPSEGVVRFAPADQGGKLLGEVGGTAVEASASPSAIVKFGKQKELRSASPYLVPARFADKDVTAALAFYTQADLSTAVGFPDKAPVAGVGDIYRHWIEVGVKGGPTVEAWVVGKGDYALAATVDEARYPFDGVLGGNVLGRYDLAYDPAAHKLAFALVEGERKAEGGMSVVRDAAEQALKAAIEKSKEDADQDDAASGDEGADKPEGDPGAYARLAKVLDKQGHFDEAVENLQKVVAFDEDKCESWLNLGEMQRKAGKFADARASFTKAAELYESWYGLPDDQRIPYGKSLDLQEKGGIEAALLGWTRAEVPEDVKRQDASCQEAYGQIAALDLLEDRAGEVGAIYDAHMDLDPWLAVARGHAALALDDGQGAQEAYRQAILHETEPLVEPRVGLAVRYAREGDIDKAGELFAKAVDEDPDDLGARFLWLDAVREQQGQDAALKLALEQMNAMPGHAAPLIALVREARIAGDDKVMGKARKRAEKLLGEEARLHAAMVGPKGLEAIYRAEVGELDRAAALADEALEGNARCWRSWFARAEAARAQGDAAAEADALKHVLQLKPFDAYAAIRLGEL